MAFRQPAGSGGSPQETRAAHAEQPDEAPEGLAAGTERTTAAATGEQQAVPADDSSSPQRPGDRSSLSEMLFRDYRRLQRLVGRSYLALTLLVRLPSVIMPLSVLVYVSAASGSGWWGSLCAGAIYLGHAISTGITGLYAPWKHYQWGILIQTVLQVAAVLWLVRSLVDQAQDPSGPWPWYLCLLVGAASPQLGIATRIRWPSILYFHRDQSLSAVAMRHEAVMDALAMVVGALVAGVVAVAAGSLVGIMAGSGLLVLCTAMLLFHPTSGLPVWGTALWVRSKKHLNRAELRRRRARRFVRFLPVLGGGWLGLLWGSVQIGLVYFAASIDVIESIGAQFAALGLLSAISAVITAGFGVKRPWNLWVFCAAASVLATMLMSVPAGPFSMLLVLAVIGAATGPTLVAVFGIVPIISPRRFITGLSATTYVLIQVGMALGLVIAAGLGNFGGYQTVALLPVVASTLLLATAFLFIDRRRRVAMDMPVSARRRAAFSGRVVSGD
ncbi:MFS transporter [Kocuria coralli]|uniref:MFS transporter n=1 Tax=Kocuria coralli TaxID=1461025 RepID=A0A5J5L3A1_9MICC|nr:MFS transporter [Kocuria coralli]KAA9395675.1 MFS transporter [Kocuria coralli]